MNIEDKQQSLLTFRVGPVLCCAPSLPVLSIITPPKLTHIAGSDTSQPGIFKHGPHIVKVIDLRIKFGIEQSEQTQPGNLIITICENQSFGFWVDQILDVFDFPSEGWGNLPAAIPRGVFTRTLLLNKKIHLYSEFDKLATINDLGYLKHYIQLLTQQATVATSDLISDSISNPNPDKTQKKITTEKSGTTEKKSTAPPAPKINSIAENKTTPTSVVDVIHITTDSPRHNPTKSNSTISSIAPAKIKHRMEINENTNKNKVTKKLPTTKKIITATQEKTTLSNTEQTITSKNETDKTSSSLIGAQINNSKREEVKSITNKSVYSDIDDEADISMTRIILVSIILLCVLTTGIYYLVAGDMFKDSIVEKDKLTTKTELNIDSEIPELSNEKAMSESFIAATDISPSISTSPIKPDTETNLFNAENNAEENKKYRADITQRDDEITITIHQSDSVETLSNDIMDITATPTDTTTPEKIEAKVESVKRLPTLEKLKREELKEIIPTKKVAHEVIHIVVKGDTLWAIAKKYVNDPFLYPELARLSNIKNPHRIYPGNRVRIRFIKN